MTKRIDLVGTRFGRLVVSAYAGMTIDNKQSTWECTCDCGNKVTRRRDALLKGKGSQSCGCYMAEKIEAKKQRKAEASKRWHGGNGTRLHTIWKRMKDRCSNENADNWQYYGARGIRVCDAWVHSFVAFRDWAMANGYTDDLSIDRIDYDGNYEPSNCRWATRGEQARNTRGNHVVLGRCLAEWTEVMGFSKHTIKHRLKRGWSYEKACTTPLRK